MKKLAILSLVVCLLTMAGTAQAKTKKSTTKNWQLVIVRADMQDLSEFEKQIEENLRERLKEFAETTRLAKKAAKEAENALAYTQAAEEVGKEAQKTAEQVEQLKNYTKAILNTGKETGRFSQDYTEFDVLNALVQAKTCKEEASEPEIYAAEEFLQYMREHFYTQNPGPDFPDAFTPTFMAKVLRILK